MPNDPNINAEQRAALDAMEKGEGTGAPGAAGDPPGGGAPGAGAGPTIGLDEAMAAAVFVVTVLADVIARRWPETAYTPKDRTAAAGVIAPLFVKYGITPAWLERWREEAAAVLVVGGLALGGYQRVKAARAAAPAPGAPGALGSGARYTETKIPE